MFYIMHVFWRDLCITFNTFISIRPNFLREYFGAFCKLELHITFTYTQYSIYIFHSSRLRDISWQTCIDGGRYIFIRFTRRACERKYKEGKVRSVSSRLKYSSETRFIQVACNILHCACIQSVQNVHVFKLLINLSCTGGLKKNTTSHYRLLQGCSMLFFSFFDTLGNIKDRAISGFSL